MEETRQLNENEIFLVDPTEVKISEDRPRQRRDLGDVEGMLNSIKKYGQLLPVIIDRDNGLVAGGRRLAACLLGGIKVRVSYKDTVDPLLLRELELEENIQRKSLTPSEEVLAIDELMRIKKQIYGESTSGRTGGFTIEKAAALLGKSVGSVVEDLKLADAVKNFPDLSSCKTKSEIKKAVKGLERISTNVQALASYEEKLKREKRFVLVNRDAEQWLEGIADASVDLLFTDPPYGIDIHDITQTTGGATGGQHTTTGIKYDDSETGAKKILSSIVSHSYRITKDTGHALIFCAPSHFAWLSEQMHLAGWFVAPRPVVWIKRETGQNNQPSRWFSAAYEFILFARKTNSALAIEGKSDWIQCDPVNPNDRIHQAEKPILLCKELISRVCHPGSYVIDPCMGSGALVYSAVQLKMFALGCEKQSEIYASAVSRLSSLTEE